MEVDFETEGCLSEAEERDDESEKEQSQPVKASKGVLEPWRSQKSLHCFTGLGSGAGRKKNHSHTDPTSLTTTRQGWQGGMCAPPPCQPRNLDSNWRQQESQSRCGPCSINRYVGLRLRCKKMLAQRRCSEEINNFLLNAVEAFPGGLVRRLEPLEAESVASRA